VARRTDIDWEAVEKDYRAGVISIAAIAEKHGVSQSQVKVKAKAGEWTRDLSAAIKARTKAKVATIDVAALVEQSAAESAGKSARLIQEAIEQASDVAAGVIVRHRADIRLQQERAQRLEGLFDDMIAKTPTSVQIDPEHPIEALNVGDVFKLSQTFKAIVETRSKLMDKEREAFGITEGRTPGEDDDVDRIEVTFVDVGPAEQ
jgi:uncharacterized protein YjcR